MDVKPAEGVDLVADVFNPQFWRELPHEKWDVIACKNVVNYAPSYTELKDFFHEVHAHLEPNGVFELEFMNAANHFTESGTLFLHPLIVKTMLWDARLYSKVLTKRHWLVPTGNVKIHATR